jgi:GAF domain-containing protein
MRAVDVTMRLEAVRPLRLQAIELIAELADAGLTSRTLDVSAVLDRQDRIEDAVAQLQSQAEESRNLVNRCKRLEPTPSRWLPLGF